MLEISTLADIASLRENFEVEYKLAAGKDGKGTLPKDFWETYSAFANSLRSGHQAAARVHVPQPGAHARAC